MGEPDVVIEHQIEILQQISEIADSAGVVNQIDRKNRRIVMAFTLEPGRTHIVYANPSDAAPAGQPTVTVSSPCTIFKNGLRPRALYDTEQEPVFANGRQPAASYAVVEHKENSVVVASLVHDLNSLGENELLKSLACVALAAESYEERFGPHGA